MLTVEKYIEIYNEWSADVQPMHELIRMINSEFMSDIQHAYDDGWNAGIDSGKNRELAKKLIEANGSSYSEQAVITCLEQAQSQGVYRPEEKQQAVPDGWRLVPVEPDHRMIGAGLFAIKACPVSESTSATASEMAVKAYRAMLFAAPQLAEQSSGVAQGEPVDERADLATAVQMLIHMIETFAPHLDGKVVGYARAALSQRQEVREGWLVRGLAELEAIRDGIDTELATDEVVITRLYNAMMGAEPSAVFAAQEQAKGGA